MHKWLGYIPLSLGTLCVLGCFPVLAAVTEYHVQLKDHLFFPSRITIPANQKVKLIIENQDNTPEEFDSFSLNREKVIFANQKATIFIGPLQPGEYNFFGEYNPNTARGAVIVERQKLKMPNAH
ncbi:cupredoxin domain-containing protein [Paraglaciecola arctica]|uniref:cupredoxin domain-containing protein n=1 Tax=Paraglaciecola arctica TaxID=1128911 RepID=UPI001C0666DD|nr:cupredoxin domain-containing protein [Paraglaciecola arctica]MBU3006235.1 cupredoxin domain-containing protein [Paraglaciecola arctica]